MHYKPFHPKSQKAVIAIKINIAAFQLYQMEGLVGLSSNFGFSAFFGFGIIGPKLLYFWNGSLPFLYSAYFTTSIEVRLHRW